MNKFYKILCLAFFVPILFGCAKLPNDTMRIDISPADATVSNPDRGFFKQARVIDSFSIPDYLLRGGLVRVYFHIPGSKDQPHLPQSFLAELDESLSKAKRTGTTVILRWMYDYPNFENEIFERSSLDPDQGVILHHVNQIGSVLRRHSGSISAIESGMFGFWGEQHGSRRELQSDSFMLELIGAWLSATSTAEIPILVRYPSKWTLLRQKHTSLSSRPLIGRWNDCAGAKDDPDTIGASPINLKYEDILNGGEVCQLPPAHSYSCPEMITYLHQNSFDYLNIDFFPRTISRWKEEGCFQEISNNLGYRIALVSGQLTNKSIVDITIQNQGWGKSAKHRRVFLKVNNDIPIPTSADLFYLGPGKSMSFKTKLSKEILQSDTVEIYIEDGVKLANRLGNRITFMEFK